MPSYGVCDNLGDQWFATNDFDTATTTGGAVPGLGVERLRDTRLGKVWRTPTGGATLTIVFQPTTALQVFGLFGINPYTVTGLTLDIGTSIGGSEIRSGPWTPTITLATKQALWLNCIERPGLAAPDVVEIRLGVPANVDIGRVWAGDLAWTPTVSHNYGSDQDIIDLSAVQRTRRSGAVLADTAKTQRVHNLQYEAISQSEWDSEVYRLNKFVGIHKQLLFVPNYLVYPPERHAILGYREQMNPITAQTYDRFSQQFRIRESG